MATETHYPKADVEALIAAARQVLPLYSLFCDERQARLTEDGESLSQEGIGFATSFYGPKRSLETAIAKLRE